MSLEFEIKRKVEIHQTEKVTWYLVMLPKGVSQDLKKLYEGMTAGFGSLPVEVTVGSTTWKTSIFPESKDGAFLLLLKAAVRKKENIQAGKMVLFKIRILI